MSSLKTTAAKIDSKEHTGSLCACVLPKYLIPEVLGFNYMLKASLPSRGWKENATRCNQMLCLDDCSGLFHEREIKHLINSSVFRNRLPSLQIIHECSRKCEHNK